MLCKGHANIRRNQWWERIIWRPWLHVILQRKERKGHELICVVDYLQTSMKQCTSGWLRCITCPQKWNTFTSTAIIRHTDSSCAKFCAYTKKQCPRAKYTKMHESSSDQLRSVPDSHLPNSTLHNGITLICKIGCFWTCLHSVVSEWKSIRCRWEVPLMNFIHVFHCFDLFHFIKVPLIEERIEEALVTTIIARKHRQCSLHRFK